MTWRDQLLPAKLDDIEFLYERVEDRGGRRTVLFEYPGGTDPYIEDMGPSANRWTLNAFLVGPNYHVTLADLIDLLDQGGTKKFQHPYRGEFPVKLLGQYQVTHSDKEGGMASVTMTLVQAGLAFPLVPIDTPAEVGRLAAIAIDTLEARTKFSLIGAIKDVISSVLGALGKTLSAINKVNGKIAAALSLADTAAFLVDSIGDSLTDLINTPGALMNSLNNLLDSVIGLVQDLVDLVPRRTVGVEEFVFPQAEILMGAYVDLFAIEQVADVVPTRTPQADQEQAAIAAVNLNTKGASLALTSAAVADVELDSSDDAAEIQATLVAGFDEVLGTPGLDPEVFEAFAALKAATVEHLSVAQQNLPALGAYTPNQTLPALVVAHELYGDATRDREIILRNRIRHPGFVPGGVTLEVIADGD